MDGQRNEWLDVVSWGSQRLSYKSSFLLKEKEKDGGQGVEDTRHALKKGVVKSRRKMQQSNEDGLKLASRTKAALGVFRQSLSQLIITIY